MKHQILIWTVVIVAAVLFLSGLVVGRTTTLAEVRVDTVSVCRIETLVVERPVERIRTIVRYDTVMLAAPIASLDSLVSPDSVRGVLPVSSVRYSDDSTYVAVVSGYKPRLDSLVWIERGQQRSVVKSVAAVPTFSLTFGPQVGLYRTPSGWQPGVGVGLCAGVSVHFGGGRQHSKRTLRALDL